MIAIEKGIALPKKRSGRPSIYPFEDMVPGTSFVVPLPEGRDAAKAAATVGNAARTWAARAKSPLKFTPRVMDDGTVRLFCV